ncbi:pentapeptide repeat-containing protein [Parasedimentitalea maritima]|uniref:Pentapeptide repeat-containing protein n=1 Tax=Parasedimentitalea maritima TaxID=2578117 RepID=A0ABY2V0V6_9RHOB|nr:pentapeptide repeat-containing protein [Zongyanglinia marina]TLP69162.1 pentapeptide repeat-containing protein [Zongyanglinia marina]
MNTSLRDRIERESGCSGQDLSGFDFEWVDGEDELSFHDCTIRETRIKGDTLIASSWSNCKFINCEFNGANLRDARFEGSVFFEGATTSATAFRYCDMGRAKFTSCNMALVKINGCEGYDLSFDDCQMRGLDIENTKFVQTAGKRKFGTVRFKTCQLADAIFDKLDLTACTFDDCDLSYATFQRSRLVNAVMRGCNLLGIEVTDANFAGADLRGSDLDGFQLSDLNSHAGMMVSAGQQHHLLGSLGIDVSPDGS